MMYAIDVPPTKQRKDGQATKRKESKERKGVMLRVVDDLRGRGEIMGGQKGTWYEDINRADRSSEVMSDMITKYVSCNGLFSKNITSTRDYMSDGQTSMGKNNK